MIERQVDWVNTTFVGMAHLLSALAVFYLGWCHFSWWTIALALLWFALCGLAITAGYHRLFSHVSYKAHPVLRGFYLLFGAASFQNSALRWSADHRTHHRQTDRDEDPYDIRAGFWWAHIGWVFFKSFQPDWSCVRDLTRDSLVQLQHRYY